MKLAIITHSSLDDIQEQVNRMFSDVRADSLNDKVELYGNLNTTELPYKKEELGKIVYYKKISAGNIIDFMFSMNSTGSNYDTKPLDYVDYLLKSSGEKSLINFLKKRNLANKLESSTYESFKSFSIYYISVELTDEGLQDLDNVIKLVFNYLNMIKDSKKNEKYYTEIKNIFDSGFKFLEKSEDYSNYVSSISTAMFEMNTKEDYKSLLYRDYKHKEFDGEIIQMVSNGLTANNCIIMVGSHLNLSENLKNQFFKNSEFKKEKWYGTDYIEKSLDEFYIFNLNTFPVVFNTGLKIDGKTSFELRKENQFITKLNSLVYSCTVSNTKCEEDEYSNITEDTKPSSVIQDPNLKVFYKIDKTFNVPKVYINIRILSNLLKKNTSEFSNLQLFAGYLEYLLNTNLSEAIESGNYVSLDFDESGFLFSIICYSDLAEKIIDILLNNIFKFQPNEYTFGDIFETAIKRIKDNKNKQPYLKNKIFFDKMIKFNYTLYTDMLVYGILFFEFSVQI